MTPGRPTGIPTRLRAGFTGDEIEDLRGMLNRWRANVVVVDADDEEPVP
jgi:hypothetical protein